MFGRLSRTPEELRVLENELCVGPDGLCRLWITKGERTGTEDRDALEVRESAERQAKRNEAFQAEHAAMIQGSVKASEEEVRRYMNPEH